MTTVDEFLSHHGVKGQKWGVRRNRETGGGGKGSDGGADKAPKEKKISKRQFRKANNNPEVANQVFQDAVKNFGSVAKQINADPHFSDISTNPTKAREYNAVMSRLFNQQLAESSAVKTYNKDLNRAIIYQMAPDGVHMRALESKLVRHDSAPPAPDFKLIRDKDGYIIDVELVETSLKQGFTVDEFIEHFGVKGMHWGTNKRKGTSSANRNIKNKRLNDVKNRRQLSDTDLQKKVERLQLEKKLKDVTAETTTPGKKLANEILSQSGRKVASTVLTGAVLYGVQVALTKKFDGAEAAKFLKPKK